MQTMLELATHVCTGCGGFHRVMPGRPAAPCLNCAGWNGYGGDRAQRLTVPRVIPATDAHRAAYLLGGPKAVLEMVT